MLTPKPGEAPRVSCDDGDMGIQLGRGPSPIPFRRCPTAGFDFFFLTSLGSYPLEETLVIICGIQYFEVQQIFASISSFESG